MVALLLRQSNYQRHGLHFTRITRSSVCEVVRSLFALDQVQSHMNDTYVAVDQAL